MHHLAIITSMSITLRELTILALMCQISHNLPVECAIQPKRARRFGRTGDAAIFMSIVVAVYSQPHFTARHGYAHICTDQ